MEKAISFSGSSGADSLLLTPIQVVRALLSKSSDVKDH